MITHFLDGHYEDKCAEHCGEKCEILVRTSGYAENMKSGDMLYSGRDLRGLAEGGGPDVACILIASIAGSMKLPA